MPSSFHFQSEYFKNIVANWLLLIYESYQFLFIALIFKNLAKLSYSKSLSVGALGGLLEYNLQFFHIDNQLSQHQLLQFISSH